MAPDLIKFGKKEVKKIRCLWKKRVNIRCLWKKRVNKIEMSKNKRSTGSEALTKRGSNGIEKSSKQGIFIKEHT